MQITPTETRAGPIIWGYCRQIWQMLGPALGWLCLALGVLGMILPILPGLPVLLLGVALVGPRHRLLRQGAVRLKRLLRTWANHPAPLVRRAGRWARQQQRQIAGYFPRRR